MTDMSMFQTQGAESGGGGWKGYVKNKKTGMIEEIEIPYDQINPPTPGLRTLVFKGVAAPRESEGQYGWSRGVKALFLCDAPGTGNHGRMFTQTLVIAKRKDGIEVSNITNRTAIGQMIVAIRGKEITEGESINVADYLNGKFMAVTEQNTQTTLSGSMVTYGNVKKDTWAAIEAEPEPVAAGVAAAANPFLDED